MIRDIAITAALQLLGVGVIIAEFILPSGGILTLAAIGAFGFSLYYVFTTVSVAAGVYFACADAVLIPVAVIIGMKMVARMPTTLRAHLDVGSGNNEIDSGHTLVGKTGTTITPLRPSGTVRIEGKRVDAISSGDFLDSNVPVEVCEISVSAVVVKKIDS